MSVEHFFLTCNIYTEHRIQLFCGMRNVCCEIDIENILFGNASFENDKNSELFLILSCIYIYMLNIHRTTTTLYICSRICV